MNKDKVELTHDSVLPLVARLTSSVGEGLESWRKERVGAVVVALNRVLLRWADEHPGGYIIPCWEEALRDVLHVATDEMVGCVDDRYSLASVSEVFVRSEFGKERNTFRVRAASTSWEEGVRWGNPQHFYTDLTRDEWMMFLREIGMPFQALTVVPDRYHRQTPWIQADGGAASRTSESPFRFLAGLRHRLLSRRLPKRASIRDGELVMFDEPPRSHAALIPLYDYFTEGAIPVLRFETLLRVMESLGVSEEELLRYERRDEPLSCLLEHRRDVLLINDPILGTLQSDGISVPCQVLLGGTEAELNDRQTFQTLWKLYGVPGMTLESYLHLRRVRHA